jgi:hypothetical protein
MASIKSLDLLYQPMCTVHYQHIAMVIKMASEYGEFLLMFFCATMVAAGANQSTK